MTSQMVVIIYNSQFVRIGLGGGLAYQSCFTQCRLSPNILLIVPYVFLRPFSKSVWLCGCYLNKSVDQKFQIHVILKYYLSWGLFLQKLIDYLGLIVDIARAKQETQANRAIIRDQAVRLAIWHVVCKKDNQIGRLQPMPTNLPLIHMLRCRKLFRHPINSESLIIDLVQ